MNKHLFLISAISEIAHRKNNYVYLTFSEGWWYRWQKDQSI